MKMATKHFKVVFIAILNYLRERWFYSLVVYRNPTHPSQPLPTAPYLSPCLSSSLPCLFQTLIINEVNQGACHFLHLIIKKFITFSSSTDLRKNTMQLLKIVIAEEEKSNKQKQKTKTHTHTHTHTKKKKTKHTKEQPSNYEFESLTKAII